MAQDETDFVWEDPPPRSHGNSQPWNLGAWTDIEEMLTFLKTKPGKWARVWTGGGYGATNRMKLLREAGCETQSVRFGDGAQRHVYARWLG